MRTKAERNKRKRVYRILSVIFILVGATRMAIAVHDLHHGAAAVGLQFEAGWLWFSLAGTFVALSRIWGELADSVTE